MNSIRWAVRSGLALLLLAGLALPTSAQEVDLSAFETMKARAIGPAGMSGRVTAIDVVRTKPDVIYAGTASGGLWMSTSGGIDWEPIFDDQDAHSIGAIAIYQKNPDVIYVGTGEGNPRNSQSSGNGMYKSLDGGRTWTHLGLEDSRNIHRVLVHPDNPDVVYVGAQGPAWGETEERGVFKTTDGGETWTKVLYVNEKTGIADLVMDPENPNKLMAAMWEFRRWPHFFESGGEGSGLYVTFDGGKTWQERTAEDGLPRGTLGRMGLAIAPTDPDIVYAYVEAEKSNDLYRSTDGGFTFQKTDNDGNVGNRPFYYAEIYVDTKNENRVYSLHTIVTYSEDGGDSFETLIPYSSVHPDHHAWYQHPDDPNFMIDGNDGGMAISRDRGKTWRFIENLPLAQFYHVNVDNDIPYHVYGGLQDNGSWKGPAYVWREGGIRNAYWQEVGFGDGFDVMVDASNPRYIYGMSQGGNLYRTDTETGDQKTIRPIHPDGEFLRFNWNAGLAQDPFDPQTIYYGSQFVHKSTDRGDTWTIISPDLTTDDSTKQRQLDSGGLTYDVTNAENFTTIVAIAPSPVERGVVWVGTDDGNVQLTRDGGQTWTNLIDRIDGVPEGMWVPQIRASAYNAGEAFVVFGDHRRNNWTPYVYHTDDFGRSWTRLVDEDDVWGYAHAIVQDPIEPNLLFLGTEFGLYVSFDKGQNWTQWTHGVPTASVMDLALQEREHDLVIGTFGRSIFILDDIRPLRALAQEGADMLDETLVAFEAPDAYMAAFEEAAGTRFSANAMFAGENREDGAMITYLLNPPEGTADDAAADEGEAEEPMEMDNEVIGGEADDDGEAMADGDLWKNKVKVEILNDAGEVIRTLRRDAQAGINRFHWNLDAKGVRYPGQEEPRRDQFREPGGMPVEPGLYTVRLTFNDQVDETQVRVHMDPRLDVSPEAVRQQIAMMERLNERVEAATMAMDQVREAQKTVRAIAQQLEDRDDAAAEEAMEMGEAMQDSLTALVALFEGEEAKGIRRDPNTVNAKLYGARRYLGPTWGMPGPTQEVAMEQAEEAIRGAVAEINAFFETDWPRYRNAVNAANVSFFDTYEPVRVSSGD